MTKGSGGGGYGSRPHVEKPIRTGTGASRMRPSGVAQIGQRQGNHFTDGSGGGPGSSSYGGININAGPMGGVGAVKLGNEVALNVGKGGPGTGRTVMKTGSQGSHGAPSYGSPMPKGELFPGWGSKRG